MRGRVSAFSREMKRTSQGKLGAVDIFENELLTFFIRTIG